ncbi:hypothetical protein CJF31_00009118 [Rutstroemia sp. NJR-2017a BVV2]|nr:hypothetical protein CJF31_00009118 [Rutstroemia sp. NJR-2017a BVV2]
MVKTSRKRYLCDSAPENLNLQYFIIQRNKFQQQTKKPKFIPKDYEINIQKLNGSGPLVSKDVDTTKVNITGICRKWKMFCEFRDKQDWQTAIRNCNKGTTIMFLRYICENYRVYTFSSIYQYLLQFKQLYNRINRHFQGMILYFVVTYSKWIADHIIIVSQYYLGRGVQFETGKNGKASIGSRRLNPSPYLLLGPGYIYISDRGLIFAKGKVATDRDQIYEDNNWDNEYESLDETKDDDPIYKSPEPWVNPKNPDYDNEDHENVLIREYKALCYEDIRLWIVRNPIPRERDLLGIEITLTYHKGANRKPKLYILDLYILILLTECSQDYLPISRRSSTNTFYILAIAIRDNAIKVDGFTYTEPFFINNLQDPTKAVLIYWKPEKLKVPIFRQADSLSISKHKALRYLIFAYYLDYLGWAAGFAQKLTSYCFRRGTGNTVDRAATTVVMRYNPQIEIFCGSYINEKVRFIVQDAVLDQPTDVGFLCIFIYISLICDPHAPIDVPEEIRKALPSDPEIMELTREREEYKSRAPFSIRKEYEQLRRQIDLLQKQYDRAIKIEFRSLQTNILNLLSITSFPNELDFRRCFVISRGT